MKKAAPYILLAVLLVAAIVINRFRNNTSQTNARSTTSQRSNKSVSSDPANRNRGFDRRIAFLEYTKHAKCRMECREITQAEVQDVMRTGVINYRKSNVKANPCPTYALEGYTNDQQHVRIVFAQCDRSTKVVTCIDLEKEWQCHCPGDDNKHQ